MKTAHLIRTGFDSTREVANSRKLAIGDRTGIGARIEKTAQRVEALVYPELTD
ncbi:hypothetical protein [Syntrophobacter fumaroxidans]|uniref:hypothetical protein n=1 Tax=Syntrophobacter fumaroxidans TaxID=119484 RepID=UPI0012947D29|nr:hypothetical protein [Syntrophobacter fumaroxidans]